MNGWVEEIRQTIGETQWRTSKWKESQWVDIAEGLADITRAFRQVSTGYKLVYSCGESTAERSPSTVRIIHMSTFSPKQLSG